MTEFTEALHPRGFHGKFGSGAGNAKVVEHHPRAPSTKTATPKGMTLEGARSFIAQHWTAWGDSLPKDQWRGMEVYQSPFGFKNMNGQLRGISAKELKDSNKAYTVTDKILADARVASKNLTTAIKKAPPLKEPMTVFREFSADQFGKLTSGMTIQDKGFVSTSLMSETTAYGQKGAARAKAIITLPAGTKAAARSQQGKHKAPGESDWSKVVTAELVLPPGATFHITSITMHGKTPHVVMEYLGVPK